MADVAVAPFDPVWLFHPDRGTNGELVEDQESYDIFVKAGWVHSPAEFGLITAPNKDQALQQSMSAGGGESPAPPPPPVAEDTRLDEMASEVEALHKLLADQQKTITTLTARVAKLEEPASAGRR